ncbi:CheR family methyltransferase [Burkholderia stagnalis]|uniref:CheR family methyltransferase n=1 Tax=Burkholderia stagnalis TaxID=1503054 RepID=UPI000F5876BC|nr:CheR family methyltransferase [Burkholderia stagnalis]RQQ35783.1 PAS domain S-box protein [Burkholderia stagnalis]RQQ39441.1 PAS domain S-box protein [Burkholderia stagnalis]RQQ54781.1 PAS domain S-box protein [Burkholderia stagnalis]RQY04347.1 PAS domain S-box protein [Burkholderia stagnalis]RQY17233.1 PAS domain S-box protein [Burkholderia stagnalis]
MSKRRGQTLPGQASYPVVGIGASAGGLSALLEFFEALPAHTSMAFVVVVHLAPDHASNLAGLLQKATGMPVMEVTSATPIEPDHVYLIAPSLELTMVDDYLRVAPNRPEEGGRRAAIDLFFRTLAEAHRERAIGIVLSGAGSDGSVGLSRIKEMGGVTLAQDPSEAEYDSMPRSAIATGMVDFVATAAEMPQRLMDLWLTAKEIHLPIVDNDERQEDLVSEAAERALREIMIILRTRTAHDFRHYKRATVLRRIERRLQVNGITDLQAYRDYLHLHPEETQALLQDMLISVTNFFRDKEAFDVLDREVLPRFFDGRGEQDRIRVWSVGCATGEEAYSVAMLLQERSLKSAEGISFQVFATDIDERAISFARAGLYPESILADVAPGRVRQFFTKDAAHYRIKKELREHMLFAHHNVLSDPPFSRLDLICCRNLLIYLDREAQIEILKMFHFALRPGGVLFLGSSESADSVSSMFTVVDKRNRIYRANMAVRGDTPLPVAITGTMSARPVVTTIQPPGRRRFSFGDLHQRLVEQHAPPSVLVSRDSEIVHLSDRAGRFLQYSGGEPSHNIIAVVRPELRLELRTAIYQALHTNRSVEARRVRIERDARSYFVNMTARPVHDPEANADFVLVLFDEVEDSMSGVETSTVDTHKDPIISQLERELQRTKEQLQSTIEQSETSTEELKASNEELQAINEELRSATEELETSKEELQSINEELTTVNAELKSKVEETGKINDDLQNLIAANDIGTIFVERNICIKRYTPRATDVFSIIPSDIGRSLLDITHRLEYDKLPDDAAEAFDSLRLIERELRSNDGRWYLARFVPYRTTEDRIDGAVLSFIDITDRRRAEDRLREGERRMRIVAEGTKDYAIITFDDAGLVTSWNAGAERIFGYTEAEMIGQSADLLSTDEDRVNHVAQREFAEARLNGRTEEERWHQRKDGTRFFASGVLSRLDEPGISGFAKIARDLGEFALTDKAGRDAPAEQLRDAGEHDALRRRDEFLAVVSHELKNPLNLISASAELIARAPESRQNLNISRAADTIRRTIIGQAQIIDDLLDISRVRTGKLSVVRTPVDMREIVQRVTHAVRDEANQRGLALHVAMTDSPVIVHADLTRIEQIVWNLVSNALKFTSRGSVDVSLQVDEHADAVLQVADTGSGIEPSLLPHVFDMFQQSRDSAARRAGLGIGLALVRDLVNLHGGIVRAESTGVGLGATFTVTLPTYRALVAADSSAKSSADTLQGLHVLMVDDDADTVETFKLLLESEGAIVRTATSGEEALSTLDGHVPDVVLSDIGMPGMDGLAFVGKLREAPALKSVICIALSGYAQEADVKQAEQAGFDAHLKKPVTLDDLMSVFLRLRS